MHSLFSLLKKKTSRAATSFSLSLVSNGRQYTRFITRPPEVNELKLKPSSKTASIKLDGWPTGLGKMLLYEFNIKLVILPLKKKIKKGLSIKNLTLKNEDAWNITSLCNYIYKAWQLVLVYVNKYLYVFKNIKKLIKKEK